MKRLVNLFLTFLKIGLFTFGGGYAMLSLIKQECVDKKNYLTDGEFKEIVVLSEATPGPISIGCSAFIGYKVSKLIGSIIATLALLLPSLIIIILISIFLTFVKDNQFIYTIFLAMRGAVILLMLNSLFQLSKNAKYNLLFFFLLIAAFSLNFFLNISSIYLILFSILLTAIYLLFTRKEGEKDA